jgi:hypothetical protein
VKDPTFLIWAFGSLITTFSCAIAADETKTRKKANTLCIYFMSIILSIKIYNLPLRPIPV